MSAIILALSGRNLGAVAFVGLGISGGEIPHNSVQVGLALFDGHARFETTNSVESQSGGTDSQRGLFHWPIGT